MSYGERDVLAVIGGLGLFLLWLYIICKKPSDSPWMREYRKQTRHDDEPWSGPCDKE